MLFLCIAVKHHFRFLDKLHSFLHGLHHTEANGDGQQVLPDGAKEHPAPVIYEDPQKRKVMMVRYLPRLIPASFC